MINRRIKNIYAFTLLGLFFLTTLTFINYLFITEKIFYIDLTRSVASVDFKRTEARPITLMFVGDIMLNRGVEYMIKKYGGGDYRFPFLKISDFLKKADILFGNLESVISDKGEKVGSIYSFRAEPEAIEGLTYAGFDIVSLANNHVFDYGNEAMKDNLSRLKVAGIDYTGAGFSEAEAYSPVIKEVKGIKIAFLAYTNLGSKNWQAKGGSSGIAWLDETIEGHIQKAKKEADLVFVSMHFGNEYEEQPHSSQRYFAHLSIDAGADLVIGHHPHVVQSIEEYKGKYIAYSLGNFVFDQGFSEETMLGQLLEVLIENGKIKEVIRKDIKINQYFQPEIINM